MTSRLILPFNSNDKDLPQNNEKDLSIRLPGSKYIANRLLPLCALATSGSTLNNIVDNDDIRAATEGLSALGYRFDNHNGVLKVLPKQVHPRHTADTNQTTKSQITFNTHHSGTFSRFVTAISALESSPIKITCSEKMATRPMKELFDALRELGVNVESNNDRLPAIITGPVTKNYCQLDASRSSQYLSALLIIAPLLKDGLKIELLGKQVSNAYVDMTIDLMNRMGVRVNRKTNDKHTNEIYVAPNQSYQGVNFEVPGDPVSSSYFMGLAAISGQTIRIEAFEHESLQGEAQFYKVLEKMGVEFKKDKTSLTIVPSGELKGIEVDMGEMPDVVQTLAVVASHAKGKTLIKNIAHLAYKESDRIRDTATELKRAGIEVVAGDDYLLIEGGQPKPARIKTYDDHRMAMSMALLGTKTNNIVIEDSGVVNKSFPSYWELMAEAGLQSKETGSQDV